MSLNQEIEGIPILMHRYVLKSHHERLAWQPGDGLTPSFSDNTRRYKLKAGRALFDALTPCFMAPPKRPERFCHASRSCYCKYQQKSEMASDHPAMLRCPTTSRLDTITSFYCPHLNFPCYSDDDWFIWSQILASIQSPSPSQGDLGPRRYRGFGPARPRFLYKDV